MILVLFFMLLFGVVHTYTAGQFKTMFRERFGERAYHGLYRLFYNAFSFVSLAPVAYLITFHPGGVVWSIDLRWELILLVIQAIGLIGLVVSLLQIDLGRFVGISQLIAYINGSTLPLSKERLQTGGLYGLVRHPLYLFSMMTIWPVTTMTEAYLGFCIGATIYFVVGSYYEERRLLGTFGEEYKVYRQRVPWLIPFMRF